MSFLVQKQSSIRIVCTVGLWGFISLAISAASRPVPSTTPAPYTTWSDYGGSADSMQYSALTQINKSNVKQLKLAWFLPAPGPTGRFSFNPLVINGIMYVIGKDNAVYAVDAATGQASLGSSG